MDPLSKLSLGRYQKQVNERFENKIIKLDSQV